MEPSNVLVLDGLLREYPFFATWDIEVNRRLLAGPDRLSNAYLVTAKSSEAEASKFVAKFGPPEPGNSRGVLAEWSALKLAQDGNVPAPGLLVPNHVPGQFLLMEFLEGMDAQSAVDSGSPTDEVFELIGEALRGLHQVRAPKFGDFHQPGGNWVETTTARVDSKLLALVEVVEPELLNLAKVRIAESLPAIDDEPNKPILIHRDVYLSNFILDPDFTQASVIDFGMACGGRPLYDLAKLFILDLYRYPAAREAFLGRYFSDEAPPANYGRLLKLYLFVELLGMIRFFHAVGQLAALEHATNVLTELAEGSGLIVDLIS